MTLHTDQWWMPPPMIRVRQTNVRCGDLSRDYAGTQGTPEPSTHPILPPFSSQRHLDVVRFQCRERRNPVCAGESFERSSTRPRKLITRRSRYLEVKDPQLSGTGGFGMQREPIPATRRGTHWSRLARGRSYASGSTFPMALEPMCWPGFRMKSNGYWASSPGTGSGTPTIRAPRLCDRPTKPWARSMKDEPSALEKFWRQAWRRHRYRPGKRITRPVDR